jgi:glutamine synthetase
MAAIVAELGRARRFGYKQRGRMAKESGSRMAEHAETVPGKLVPRELEERVRGGEIDTVIVAFPDLYGRLVGKRVAARFYLDHVAEHGMHACDYLLACDMEMDPVPGYRLTSWQSGYGDFLCRPDPATLRRASWLERSALVLCDVFDDQSGEPVAVAPRSVLRAQVERGRAAGFTALGASELEFFVLRETYESARAKRFDDLQTFGSYVEDYHLLQGAKVEPLVGALRRHLEWSGIPVETSKGEWGPGQHELNVRYCGLLEMSDRHVIWKQAAKEIAHAQGLAVTFMAKWDEKLAGSSSHLHASLWDLEGRRNLFSGDGEPLAGSRARPTALFRHWVGGLLAHAREITLFFAPYPNSYKRFAVGTFAPTRIAWSVDNRTSGFRVVGDGSGLRVECRIPGADANPYLAFAALLAAGLDGIERKLEPPAPFAGDAYRAEDAQRVPRTLPEAIAEAERSEWLRRAFGPEVVEHYLHFARTEQRKFDEAVTTWERARYLERA